MNINRRTFLQGVGASSLFASLSGLVPGVATARSRGAQNELLNKMQGEVKYHSCLRNCSDRCLLKFRVQDGRMTYVSGAKEQEKTGSSPCLKGHTYVQYTYAPDRILHPMERVGKKGEGKWRRISWDDALDKIASKLHKITEEHGSEAILPYSYSGNYGAIGMSAAGNRFFNRAGASFLDRKVCTYAAYEGLESLYGTYCGPDPEDTVFSDCFVSWGSNETASNVHGIKYINQGRDRGMKLLAVNPLRTPLCSQADVFLQPKPSTDSHLAVGIMKYIIEKEMVDHKFIETHTKDYDLLLKAIAKVSFDEIETVTGVPRALMFKFAKIYGESDKAIIRIGFGMQRNYNGARMSRNIAMINAITGNFGKIGNGVIYDNVQPGAGLNQKKAGASHLRPNPDARHINMTEIAKALDPVNPTAHDKPISPIKAVINYNGNMVAVAPDSNACIKGLMREDLFVVGHDFLMTDTLELCDIIVPSTTQFETSDIVGDYWGYYTQVCEKVIEPLGESKCNWTFFRELGQRMGYTDPEFQASNEDIIKELLDTDVDYYKGVTYERLFAEKYVKLDIPKPFLGDGKYNTPSGKIEFYSDRMKDAGYDPVIDLGLPEDDMIPAEKALEFRLLSPAIPQRVNSSFYNVKYIRNFPSYFAKINTQDAQAAGIKNNDKIRLANHRGEATYVAMVTDQVVSGTIMAPKCNWRRFDPLAVDSCTNNLTTDKLTDMGGCSAYHSTRVSLAKA